MDNALNIPIDDLVKFEKALDPQNLGGSDVPVSILGYGEISTVLDIALEKHRSFAYKRMPLFHSDQEVKQYCDLYQAYVKLLDERIGVSVVPSEIVTINNSRNGRDVVYIVQRKLDSNCIGHKTIHQLPETEVHRLVLKVLENLKKVFDFNKEHQDVLAVGIDGQMSNWGIVDLDPGSSRLPDEIKLVYIDTSTPFLQKEHVEQLDTELFLRSAPSFLTWLLRLFFLEDVVTRYYSFRSVCVDLIANMYKEQRPDLVPGLITITNEFFPLRSTQGNLNRSLKKKSNRIIKRMH